MIGCGRSAGHGIFGVLRCDVESYLSSQGRITGGTHGLGAKLTNIFSTSFAVEIYDAESQILYQQQWRDNMRKVFPPTLKTLSNQPAERSYTSVTFYPDLARLHTIHSTPHEGAGPEDMGRDVGDVPASLADVVAVMSRRVVDMCGMGLKSTGSSRPISVSINGAQVPVSSLADYMSLFGIQPAQSKVLTVSDRWAVGICQSPSGMFEHMSFVNSLWTVRGGTHVNYIAGQCVKYISSELAKAHASAEPLGSAAVKNQLMLFIQCLIENPSFDSQSKDMLTTKISKFGSVCDLPPAMLKSCFDDTTNIMAVLLGQLKDKERSRALKPTKGQFGRDSIDVEGLQDAHNAGRVSENFCSVISFVLLLDLSLESKVVTEVTP